MDIDEADIAAVVNALKADYVHYCMEIEQSIRTGGRFVEAEVAFNKLRAALALEYIQVFEPSYEPRRRLEDYKNPKGDMLL